MTIDKQNYNAQTLEFMRQAHEQNRLNRLSFNEPIMPLWKAGLAGFLTATFVIAVMAALLFTYLHLVPLACTG